MSPVPLQAFLLTLLTGAAAAADSHYFGLAVPDRPEPFQPALWKESTQGSAPLAFTNPSFSPDARRFAITAVRSHQGQIALELYESQFDGRNWETAIEQKVPWR